MVDRQHKPECVIDPFGHLLLSAHQDLLQANYVLDIVRATLIGPTGSGTRSTPEGAAKAGAALRSLECSRFTGMQCFSKKTQESETKHSRLEQEKSPPIIE